MNYFICFKKGQFFKIFKRNHQLIPHKKDKKSGNIDFFATYSLKKMIRSHL